VLALRHKHVLVTSGVPICVPDNIQKAEAAPCLNPAHLIAEGANEEVMVTRTESE
jgi:hypothetical protein